MSIFWNTVLPIMASKKITQVDISKALGKEKSTINHWIKFDRIPPANYALQIADYLGEDLRYLLTGKDSDEFNFIRTNPDLKIVVDLLKDKKPRVIEMSLVGIRAILEVEKMKDPGQSAGTA